MKSDLFYYVCSQINDCVLKTTMLDIDNLLNQVSTDNRIAFDRFYNLYYEQVFRVSYYFLRDKEACREVVTDVFFSIWQSRQKLKDIKNMDTYLYTVVRNESVRYQNRNMNSSHCSLDELSLQLEDRKEDSPEEQMVTREMTTLLNQAIHELPEKCRLIFLMSREEGLKSREIAELLSISESTVRVQMKIAIDKLITRLKPYFPDITLSLLLPILLFFD